MCAAAFLKYGQDFSPRIAWQLTALCANILGAIVWARAVPGSYLAWREAIISWVRIWASASSAVPVVLVATLQRANPWQQGALVGYPLFLGLLLFSCSVVGLAWYALALRLSLPVHAIVHGMSLLLFLKQVPAVCASGAMQQVQSVSAMHGLHAVFDLVSMRWLFGAPSSSLTPAQECWAVMAALQIFLGYMVPTVVLAVQECREFLEFRRLSRGGYQSNWRTWLYENTTDAPLNAGLLIWGKVALAGLMLFNVVWDTLVVTAAM
jgi:hypothetical protein